MKENEQQYSGITRWYIVRSKRKTTAWKVLDRDVEMFLELFGKDIRGIGDTKSEAIDEWLRTEEWQYAGLGKRVRLSACIRPLHAALLVVRSTLRGLAAIIRRLL